MAKHRLLRGPALLGPVHIGGGGLVKKVAFGTQAIDPGSIAATSKSAVTFTLTGAADGDVIVMNPPTGMNDDILFVGASVTAADTVTVFLYNPTAGAIDDGSVTWDYLWFDLT